MDDDWRDVPRAESDGSSKSGGPEADDRGHAKKIDRQTRYQAITEDIFFGTMRNDPSEMRFQRAQIVEACERNNITPPKNIGDVLYDARYRYGLPTRVLETAPEGREWA